MGQPGRMVEVDAPRVLGWTWGGERYRFELRPDGDGCLLVFTHVFDDRLGPAAQHAAGWEAYLDRLQALLAGGHLSEEAGHASIAERHERYAQRFGQDPQPGRRAIAGMAFRDLTLADGPVLRLERRYPHPVQRVWRALTDPEELAQWFPSGEPLAITHAEAPRMLAATWYGDLVRFELRAEGEGCVLTFTHAFADRDTSARTAAGWDRAFARVGRAAGGRRDERGRLARGLARRPRALRAGLRGRPGDRARGLRGPSADLSRRASATDDDHAAGRLLVAQRVGEAPRHARRRRPALLLPQRHDDELGPGAVAAADEDQRAVDEVAHVQRAASGARARRRLVGHAPGLPRAHDAGDDLAARVDLARAPAHALAEALGGVIGHRDQDAHGSSVRW